MSVILDAAGIRAVTKGVMVSRATAALPQTAAAAIFTVSGRVMLTAIWGEVTTVIQTQADATKLTFDPTDAGATQNLCATADITGLAVGSMVSITGTPATALQIAALNFLSPNQGLAAPGVILKSGQILLDCAASNTGAIKWDVLYTPLDAASGIVVA